MKSTLSPFKTRKVNAFALVFLAAVCLVFGAARLGVVQVEPAASAAAHSERGQSAPSRRPLDFVENRGQWDPAVKFTTSRGAMLASFEQGAIRLLYGKEQPARLGLHFEGASAGARLAGEDRRGGRYNFFVGKDRARWRTDVPAFGSVLYRGLYEGIDLRVREAEGRLEYDLILAPGADLERVRIRAEGANGIQIEPDGSLLLKTGAGALRQTPPRTWEVLPNGEKRAVECRFRKIGARHYGFTAPARDRSLPLVIDPGLEWATYLGGGEWDEINDLAATTDGTGDVIAVGATLSPDFSGRANPVVGFVTRFSANGTLVYQTILGGTDREWINGVAVSGSGDAVVVGESYSPDYPTTPGAFDASHGVRFDSVGPIYEADAFVTRLNPAGQIVFSTFLGTDDYDLAYAVAFAPNGAIVVAGETDSQNFPTTAGAYDRTRNCCTPYFAGVFSELDAFVARLSADGSALEYSTYLGGNGDEPPAGVVVDAGGFVTLTGLTYSPPGAGPDFPTTADALQRTPLNRESNPDAYLARLRLDGNGTADLKYSTFLGGGNTDEGYAVALDPLNPQDVLVGGVTYSTAGVTPIFPTTAGTLKSSSTSIDGFVMRFRFPSGGGGSLVWSTLFGGFDYEDVSDLAVNAAGDIFITGGTRSFDLPTTRGSFDRSVAISSGALFFDAYAARLSGDGARVVYATYLGGAFNERFMNLALVGPDTAAVSGWTNSGDFPVTPNAHDPVLNDDGVGGPGGFGGVPFDGFLARLSLVPDGDGDDTAFAPPLLSPANNAPAATNTAITFDWADVSDPAGIDGYHIQINQRPDFVCCNDWQEVWTTRSEHVASLRLEGPYFWRVRTADRSGNLSDWSEVRSLNAGTTISTLTVNPSTVEAGRSAQGQVTLTAGAPPGGLVVFLSSSNAAVASVPASVTIPSGSAFATFTVTARAVSAATAVQINGTHGGNTRSAALTVTPAAAPPAAPTLVSPANGARVPLNQSVAFTWNAVGGAATYEIQIDDSDRFSSPLVGSQSGLTQTQYAQTFTSERRLWWRVRGRTAGGTNGAWSAVRSFEVRRGTTQPPPPPPPAPASLSALTLSPSSVTGGNSSQGTVTLTAAAPSGGAVVALSSGNTNAATVPASVTVPAGATSASFAVTTRAVTASTAVGITASYNGVARAATLTVNPASAPPPPPPPPQTDTVAVQIAEYASDKRELRVEATSTNSSAVLRCYVSSTGALIGTLTNDGGGRYRGQFSWPSNPQSITVRSSLGGSATRTVAAR